jgi:hypothetical protein
MLDGDWSSDVCSSDLLGGRYYDYEYTGSGNPLGAPVKITDVMSTDALFPVVDKVWNLYLSATMKF